MNGFYEITVNGETVIYTKDYNAAEEAMNMARYMKEHFKIECEVRMFDYGRYVDCV